MTDRVVVLIDMDCFYCQVEARLNPSLIGKPMAVVQYNQWKGGGIIAVNYEARDRGVTRHMRGAEAKEHCPDIILVTVPTIRDKADLTRYRDAGREVLNVFCRFSNCVQRASIDEAFIDITSLVDDRMKTYSQFDASLWKSSFVVGYSTDGLNNEDDRKNGMKSWLEDCESIHNTTSLRLAVGGIIVEEMREAVLQETGFKCSAGIAHNKILAKLACGLHKPNRQTLLPQESVEGLYKTLSVKKIRNLGGKFGDEVVEKLGCNTMADLAKYSERDLQNRYDEKTGTWLYNIARGYDYEAVTPRLVSKSIGCCKKFPGKQALINSEDVKHWLSKLAEELSERLLEDETMNKRRAELLTVSTAIEVDQVDSACSKSIALCSYNTEKIMNQAEISLRKLCKIDNSNNCFPPLKFLGLSAGKFSLVTSNKIDQFFKHASHSTPLVKNNKCDERENIEEGSKMSFFEKKLAKDVNDSAKKMHLVPNFTKNDLFIDSDDSQSSIIKKQDDFLPSNDSLKESLKRNLFTTSDPSERTLFSSGKNITTQGKILSFSNKESEKNNKRKNNDHNSNSISVFFSNPANRSDCWTKPEELFPDLNQVDEEVLSFLPESYRKKIMELKKNVSCENVSSSDRITIDSSYNNRDDFPTSNNCDDLETKNPDRKSLLDGQNHCQLPATSPVLSEVRPNGNLSKCEECGECVLDYELHTDMHLAKKLHKELNSFSTVINKQVLKTNQNEKKKRKIKSKDTLGSVKKANKSIESFFSKI